MDKRTENLFYNQAGKFVESVGALRVLLNESEEQVNGAINLLIKVRDYLAKFPDLNGATRAQISRLYHQLKTHVDELEEALFVHTTLIGIVRCKDDYLRIVPPPVVIDGKPVPYPRLRDIALAQMDGARERALRAIIKNETLIQKLATLCDYHKTPTPYNLNQGKRKTPRKRI